MVDLSSQAPTDASGQLGGKYLIVRLGREEYGVAVLRVREIIRSRPAAAVPHTPDYLIGVINLRGKVIPVVDLRLKFGLPVAACNEERSCIVVLELQIARATALMGMVVDEVVDVAQIESSEIERVPEFAVGDRGAGVLGLAKTESGVRILLDTDQVLALDPRPTNAESVIDQAR